MNTQHLPFLVTLTLAATAGTGPPATHLAEGIEAFDRGAFEEAERFFLRRLAGAQDAEAAYELARARIALARYQAAYDAVEQAIAQAPTDARFHRLRGETLGRMAQEASVFKQLGLAKRGLAAFEKAVALDPRYVEAKESLLEYYLRAPGFAGGSLTKARAQADAIGSVAPAKGRRAHGRIHAYRKETDQALAHYRAAVELDPNDLDIRYDFGLVLIDLERWDEARAHFEAMLGVAEDPADDDYRALHELGRLAAASGEDLERGAEALARYLDRAVRYGHPPHADAQVHLGRIRSRQNDPSGARQAYQAALALDPEHEEARKALRRLR